MNAEMNEKAKGREGGGGKEGDREVTVNTHARHNGHTINTVRQTQTRREGANQNKDTGETGRGWRELDGRDRTQPWGSHFFISVKVLSANFRDSKVASFKIL